MTDLDLDSLETLFVAVKYGRVLSYAEHDRIATDGIALIASLRAAREAKERAYRAFNEQSIARSKAMDCGCSDHDGACGECVTCWSKNAAEAEERAESAERALAEVTRERDALKGERDELVGRLRARTRLLAESRAGRGVPEEAREALLGLVEDARESGLTTWPTIVEAWLDAERQQTPARSLDTSSPAAEPTQDPNEIPHRVPPSGGDSGGLRADNEDEMIMGIWSCLADGCCPETCARCHPDKHPPAPDRFAEGWRAAIEAAAFECEGRAHTYEGACIRMGQDGEDPTWHRDRATAYRLAAEAIRALQPGKGER